jgi:hypothetical protein
MSFALLIVVLAMAVVALVLLLYYSCFTTCCSAGFDTVTTERALEVGEQHHVEQPKTGHHSGKEQRKATGGRP